VEDIEVSEKLFTGGVNVVLAHGKDRYNANFQALRQDGTHDDRGRPQGIGCLGRIPRSEWAWDQ
jgi:hypothetical protein